MFKLAVNNLFKECGFIKTYSLSKSYDLTRMAVLLALLIICSQVALPIGPVPVTLQTLAVLLIGLTAGPKHGALITGLYMAAGLLGLPIFAGFSGGFQAILSPSFGFIIGFIPATASGAHYFNKISVKKTTCHYTLAALLMTLIIYLVGVTYMFVVFNGIQQLNFSVGYLLQIAFIPFIPGDILKAIAACAVAKRINFII